MGGIPPREAETGAQGARMSEFSRFRSFLILKGLRADMAYISRPKAATTRKNTCFQTPTTPSSFLNEINSIRRNMGARPKLLCPLASTNRGLAPRLEIAFYSTVHSRRQAQLNQEVARDSGQKCVFRNCRNCARSENGNVVWNQRKCGSSGSGGPRQGRRPGIVGVVHAQALGTFQRRAEPALYFPMSQDVLPRMSMIIHAAAVNGPLLSDLRRTLEAVPGRGPSPILVRSLETYLDQTSLAPLHIATVLLGVAAVMVLLLAVLGLFGVLSDVARQRRRELAVRVALGAQRWRVIGHVLGEGFRLAGAGTLAGMLASLALSPWMSGITRSGGSPAPWVWLAAPIALAGVVLLASILPARRALLMSPVTIMREDG